MSDGPNDEAARERSEAKCWMCGRTAVEHPVQWSDGGILHTCNVMTADTVTASEREAIYARLKKSTDALVLVGRELEAALDHVNAIAALAATIARLGIAAGKAALVNAGVPAPVVELAGRLAESGIEKARGKVAGA